MDRKTLVLIAFCLTVVCVGIWVTKKGCRPWGCWTFSGYNKFVLKETYFTSNTSFRGLFDNGTFIMRVDQKILSYSESPENEHNAQTMRFSEMFTKAPAPYPGDVSDTIVCPDTMIPQKKVVTMPNGLLTYFTAYFGKRLNFGICSLPDAEGIGVYAVLYCKKDRSLEQIEFFGSDNKKGDEKTLEKIVQSISCS